MYFWDTLANYVVKTLFHPKSFRIPFKYFHYRFYWRIEIDNKLLKLIRAISKGREPKEACFSREQRSIFTQWILQLRGWTNISSIWPTAQLVTLQIAAMRPSCEINLLHQIKPRPSAERLLVTWPEHESCAYSIFQCGNSPSRCLPAGSCPHTSGHSLHLAYQCNLNTCFLQILLVWQIWFISHLFRRHVTEVHKHVLLLWFQGWSTIYRLLSDGLF